MGKTTLSARVPEDVEERFEEYRQSRGMNKTNAVRRLLEEGLDAVEEREESDDPEVTEASLFNNREAWLRIQFERFAPWVLISAPVFVVSLFAYFLPGVSQGTTVGTLVTVVFAISLIVLSFSAIPMGVVIVFTNLIQFYNSRTSSTPEENPDQTPVSSGDAAEDGLSS
jgi:hypothetical protein